MTISHTTFRLLILGGIVTALAVIYITLSQTGAITFIKDGAALNQWIQQFQIIGPLVIIGLMTVAIVMSPIPSAPIALAAGAAYGHTAGTVYVIAGSELGAIIAFFIGRLAGVETLRTWVDVRLNKGVLDSQKSLMGVVFASRLLPFISFDMVSYAAGVTPLSFWRFAIATLAGIIPASFLLTHFGSEMVSGETERIGITLLLLAGVTIAIMFSQWISRRRKK